MKPRPDIFLHALETFKVSPSRAVVVKIRCNGIHGAVAAGCRVIGFTGASHTYPSHADRLTDAGAETVIARMSDLPATIAALGEWAGAL